jgi:hypothetical protein
MTTAINAAATSERELTDAQLDAVVGGFSDTLKKMLTPAPKTVGIGFTGHSRGIVGESQDDPFKDTFQH